MEDQGQENAIRDEQPVPGQRPSDKLDDRQPTDRSTPGAQNPESKEIKKETNPNSE
jgi:hypothetical protein